MSAYWWKGNLTSAIIITIILVWNCAVHSASYNPFFEVEIIIYIFLIVGFLLGVVSGFCHSPQAMRLYLLGGLSSFACGFGISLGAAVVAYTAYKTSFSELMQYKGFIMWIPLTAIFFVVWWYRISKLSAMRAAEG